MRSRRQLASAYAFFLLRARKRHKKKAQESCFRRSAGGVAANIEEPVSRPKARSSRLDILRISGAYAGAGILSPAPRAARSQPLSAGLVDAARREGTLTFYTAMELPLAESLKRRFEGRYPGISVRLKRSGAERILQRIDPEG